MEHILNYLQNISRKNLFQKKIILMPSYLDGNALKKNLTLRGFTAINFNITTLFDIARDSFSPVLLKNEWKILDSSLGQILVFDILKVLSSEEKLSYFKLPSVTPSLASSIFRTIKEIRVSGYTSHNFPQRMLEKSPKMRDIMLIMRHYEEKLKDRRLIDEADLYTQAAKLKSSEEEMLFIVPSNLSMNELELRFFDKKIKPKAVLFQLSCPEARTIPHNFPLNSYKGMITESWEEQVLNTLSHIESIDSLKLPALNMKFHQTYGEYNETREVLRTIVEEEYPCDRVQVFYTTQEPYSQYFYQLSLLYQIPMTFHSGISIKNSHPAQFLFSLLDWINDNYSITKLVTLLKYSSIDIDLKEDLALQRFTSLLRESPIGWGRERYIPGLDLAIEEKKRKMGNTSEEKAQEFAEDIQCLLAVKEWVREIFAEIPDFKPENRISLPLIARNLSGLVKKYTLKDKSNIDEEAVMVIEHRLSTLEEALSLEFPANEALLLIRNLIEQERINCSPPLPGHLHIASYKKGIWLNRFYTFIVGMDYQKFPASSDEETILLEKEKEPFRHLLNNNEKNRIEQLRLLQLILSQKGKKYLSFSCYDTVTQHEQAPANLFFHLYRLQKKNILLDYNTFYQDLSPIRNFIPQNSAGILDEGEYFLYFGKKEKIDLQPLFSHKYYTLQEGIRADRTRREEGFNIYNGNIEVKTAITDARENRGIVVSASKLERIAFCPYLYFLVDVLKIKPPKEMVYDPTTWLNPLERGLLLHKVYEEFYQTLLGNTKSKRIEPSYSKHWLLLKKITEENLAEKRRYLAPPGELVYESEKKGILESCQVFLKVEEEIYKKYANRPLYFELAFGTRDSEHEILGKVKAVELRFPDGSRISIQGKMDRVDILPDGTYLVIDYKTGSSRDYKKNNPFRYGQQIQHALYAIALESILAKREKDLSPKVSESGYYFPTVAGQGNLVLYEQQNREQVLEIINILLNIVAKGNFSMIQKADDLLCKDYKDIMEQNEVIALKGKKAEKYDNEPALEEIRRLQQFE